MGERKASYYINGTSALDMRGLALDMCQPHIIEFPGACASAREPRITMTDSTLRRQRRAGDLRTRVREILDSSEMYCSLRYESITGCPYSVFTKKGVAALSAGASVIGLLSVIFGA